MPAESSFASDTTVAGFVQRLPLYVGGFMGPFGTLVVIPMFPELGEHFGTSKNNAALSFSLYLIPFAIMLLVSGTLGERWGRRRTVRSTYLVYAAASIGCVVAPTLGLFVAARAVQGLANAFFTPLLLAGLAGTVAPDRFGRQVGIYSSFQALGGGLGTVVGGVAADTDWRWAFVGTLVISLVLAFRPPPGEPRPQAEAPNFRPLLTTRMILFGLAFFAAAAGPIGISVLVGDLARSVLDLSGTTAGVILFFGSMAALATGLLWGALLERFGAKKLGFAVAVASVGLAGLPSLATGAWSLGFIWVLASAAIAAVVVMFQALGASIMPDNRRR